MREQAVINRRDEILQAAEQCFAHHGYTGATLNIIADIIGIRRPSLLHHFKNKVTLYEHVLERMFDRQFESLNVIDEQHFSDTDSKLAALVDNFVQYAFENPNYLRILMHNLAGATDPGGLFKALSVPTQKIWLNVFNTKARECGKTEFRAYEALALSSGSLAFISALYATQMLNDIDQCEQQRISGLILRVLNAAFND